jgi:hypothetical protein
MFALAGIWALKQKWTLFMEAHEEAHIPSYGRLFQAREHNLLTESVVVHPSFLPLQNH